MRIAPPTPPPSRPSCPSMLSPFVRFLGVIVFALMLAPVGFFAPSANASVIFTATASNPAGNPLSALSPGDLVTIDITIRSDGDPIFGMLAAVHGYDRNVVSFVSGTASPALFSSICLPAAGCFGGLLNMAAVDLVEEDGRVIFANALTGAGVSNTGEADRGVDGVAGGPQARVTFQILGEGTTEFLIGTDLSFGGGIVGAGGSVEGTTNAVVVVTMLPEPNTTLLLGLGLALLSGSRPTLTFAGTPTGTLTETCAGTIAKDRTI